MPQVYVFVPDRSALFMIAAMTKFIETPVIEEIAERPLAWRLTTKDELSFAREQQNYCPATRISSDGTILRGFIYYKHAELLGLTNSQNIMVSAPTVSTAVRSQRFFNFTKALEHVSQSAGDILSKSRYEPIK